MPTGFYLNISPQLAAAVIGAGIVLSPILVPAALVYVVASKVQDGVAAIKRHRNVAAAEAEEAWRQFQPSAIKDELQRLMDAVAAKRSFATLFAFGAGLCGYKDYNGSIRIFEEAIEVAGAELPDLQHRNVALANYYISLAYQQSRRLAEAVAALDASEVALTQYHVKEGEVTLRRADIVAARAFLVFLRAQDEVGTDRQEGTMQHALELINEAIADGKPDVMFYGYRAFFHYEMAWLPYRSLAVKPGWYEDAEIFSHIRSEFALKALEDIETAEGIAVTGEGKVSIDLLSLRVHALFVVNKLAEAVQAYTELRATGVPARCIDVTDPFTARIGNFATSEPWYPSDAITEHFLEHQLVAATFKSPSWCNVCRELITLRENMKNENCKCDVCDVRCHDRCREALLKNSCLGSHEDLVVANHKHVVSKRFIHSLHRCQFCKKSIMMMKDVYCCQTCPAYFHAECAATCHSVIVDDTHVHSTSKTAPSDKACCHQ